MTEENNVQKNDVRDTGTTTAVTPGKTFTQADVDELIQKRLDRERKKYLTEEEIAAFRNWQESRDAANGTIAALTGERDTARTQLADIQNELEQMKREKFLTGKGIPADDLDYYAFKIGKLVTDKKTFEDAAEEFLKDNTPNRVRVDMTAPLDGGKPTTETANSAMNALIRGAFK